MGCYFQAANAGADNQAADAGSDTLAADVVGVSALAADAAAMAHLDRKHSLEAHAIRIMAVYGAKVLAREPYSRSVGKQALGSFYCRGFGLRSWRPGQQR